MKDAMKISKLLEGVDCTVINGNNDIEITNISRDSKQIKDKGLFFCIKGLNVDGHKFAKSAIENGAVALIVQDEIREDLKDVLNDNIAVIKVENTRRAMPYISANFYEKPAEDLKVIAIVGTKGKTTTAFMIRDVLKKAGHKVGLMGTIFVDDGESVKSSGFTTPEADDLHKYLYNMRKNGCEFVVMEVSSQSFLMNRSDGIVFDLAIFTNISEDHIGQGEHKDFDDYFNCTKGLLKQAKRLVFNADADFIDKMVGDIEVEKLSFSAKKPSNYIADKISLIRKNDSLGVYFTANDKPYELSLPGEHNVHNALAAIAVGDIYDVPYEIVFDALQNIRISGRMEMIDYSDKFVLLIDYAHNAMSLDSSLKVLRKYNPARLICLFGCGGNRAKDRRFSMGEASGKLADLTIATSDNPRFEEPDAIIDDIIEGLKHTTGEFIRITDRKEAIKYALDNAKKGDIVLLAGKGHETYQEIKGVKYPMDERVMISELKDVCMGNS